MPFWLRRLISWDWRRPLRFWWQRRTRGWDDSETWNLDYEFYRWLAPRLERFREVTKAVPHDLTEDEWDHMLGLMADAVRWYTEHAYDTGVSKGDCDRALFGLKLVGERISDLWW